MSCDCFKLTNVVILYYSLGPHSAFLLLSLAISYYSVLEAILEVICDVLLYIGDHSPFLILSLVLASFDLLFVLRFTVQYRFLWHFSCHHPTLLHPLNVALYFAIWVCFLVINSVLLSVALEIKKWMVRNGICFVVVSLHKKLCSSLSFQSVA